MIALLRGTFWTAALVCLLVLMAPTLRKAGRCARRAPTFDAWVTCLGTPLTRRALCGIDNP